ncbi:hypothetical protein Fcan01_02178 [Folsomia candida]|uniref:Uncharacterized protein n=1 Tax=Folsomia candida TaxID=158441 RepID=A0A226F4L6_FOLCA|nr:hypothetical protein Fcan01_02178 [Folsomia candida]
MPPKKIPKVSVGPLDVLVGRMNANPLRTLNNNRNHAGEEVASSGRGQENEVVIDISDNEDELGSLDELNRSSTQPGPSTPQPHYRHGNLSKNKHEQLAREELLDWLGGVAKMKPRPVRNDTMREDLERKANWGQQRYDGKLEVLFATSIPKSPVKGYYITRSDGKRNGLSSYYGSQMRGGISQAKSDRNEAYLDPSHPLHENIKMSMTQSTHNRPPMDLIYVATLFPPEEIKPNLMETHLGLEPVQSEEGSNHGLVEEYGGSCCGDKGQFSIRASHFTMTSEIYIRTIGRLVDPMACMEKKIILCDSTSTKEMGEGFMMIYMQRYNRIHNCNRYIITVTATPPPDIIRKAQKYADDGVPLFNIIQDGDQAHPPPWATLDEDLIVRYDPRHPDVKRHYKHFQNLKQLIDEFGEPPTTYYVTGDGSRDHLKRQFDAIIASRDNN